jgi:hypothetical protein
MTDKQEILLAFGIPLDWADLIISHCEICDAGRGETTTFAEFRDIFHVVWGAFVWGDTPEGHNFWSSVSKGLKHGVEAFFETYPTPASAHDIEFGVFA